LYYDFSASAILVWNMPHSFLHRALTSTCPSCKSSCKQRKEMTRQQTTEKNTRI
jgi:hypothetical protein